MSEEVLESSVNQNYYEDHFGFQTREMYSQHNADILHEIYPSMYIYSNVKLQSVTSTKICFLHIC